MFCANDDGAPAAVVLAKRARPLTCIAFQGRRLFKHLFVFATGTSRVLCRKLTLLGHNVCAVCVCMCVQPRSWH
jgi:hypothetical protein